MASHGGAEGVGGMKRKRVGGLREIQEGFKTHRKQKKRAEEC